MTTDEYLAQIHLALVESSIVTHSLSIQAVLAVIAREM